MFSKILIANRGEIAVRIIRACKEMGITTVAVFSEADKDALHVILADESICIGPAQAQDSYLNMSSILSAAVVTGAEAVHPGYGLLSENADFAKLCVQCGLTFIGPSSDMLARMGDKNEARKTAVAAGVPVIPGSEVLHDIDQAKSEAKRIGYPLLIKAKAGGGGKGIRLIENEKDLVGAFDTASREALASFGDGAVYLEKYLSPVKHIEFQILGDNNGNIICLGERECSVQRKRQKLIEESPAPLLSDKLRGKMAEAAVNLASHVGYTNAGTVEFLVDGEGHFYFMEMNTRLQVEHPVTEMVSGIDLVKWQIRIASGVPLSFNQDNINIQGHAIECRINAEDPCAGFRPSAGKISLLHIPGGSWVRFDTALYQDYSVSPFYDSMIGKLIVFAQTREEALRKMRAALCELVIEGVEHNAQMQVDILNDPDFISGRYGTDLLEKEGFSVC